jgi:protein-S-isoprenylcysteine O-methyltransferase Ste14
LPKPLVFQPGAAFVAFRVMLGVWAVFEFAMNVRQTRRLGRWSGRDRSGLVLGGCLAGAIFAAVRLGQKDVVPWPGGRVWPVVVGLTLFAAGFGLRAWSIATLGRFFQYRIQVQSDHQVITTGPYRYVRHPSYSGLALILIGLALATGVVVSLVAVAVLGSAGLVVRIRAEERQLIQALGAPYERFAARRRRLVPRIW